MNSITLNAHAKINLGLDVTDKRPDGYHEVRMIMQTIGLYDTVTAVKCLEKEISITINNEYTTASSDTASILPEGSDNIMYKAAKLFMDTYNIKGGVKLELTKRIPIAAGMAGGSTDAAAVIKALNALYDMQLSDNELYKTGVRAGADVPYCITGGTMLSEGIGEILTPLSPAPNFSCLIVKPDEGISTKYVYEHLDLKCAEHPDIDILIKAIETKNPALLCKNVGNILESVTLNTCTSIAGIKAKMLLLGADCSLMSGSGPTVFGLFTDKCKAQKAFENFRQGEYRNNTFLTCFV